MRNLVVSLFLFAVVTFSLYRVFVDGNTNHITNFGAMGSVKQDNFDVNIMLSKKPVGKVSVYEPKMDPMDIETAKFYGGLFARKDSISENQDMYFYANANSSLCILKNGEVIQYRNNKKSEQDFRLTISDDEAKKIAMDFIKDKSLNLHYEFCSVQFDFETKNYIISFINTLDGRANYAFPNVVCVDLFGTVTSMDYYHYSYVKTGDVDVFSEEKAFEKLDTLKIENAISKIDLKKCSLVYYNESGKIVPQYLFMGEFSNGNGFQSFIQAK